MTRLRSKKQSQRTPLQIIAELSPYLWTTSWRLRLRIFISLFFIITTMILNISVPLILKKIITSFSAQTAPAYIQLLLLSYGFLWLLSQITYQLREIVLFRVMAHAIHLISTKIFAHFHDLSLRFHLDRRTGAITSAIERAQDSFPDIFWGLFLSLIPTIIEILVAITILWSFYGSLYGLILLIILVIYTACSIIGSEWSANVQRISNEKHFSAQARIVDSLLNFETVKYFGNKDFERKQVDQLLQEVEDASTKKYVASESVHLIQGFVIGTGLIILTWLSGNSVIKGTMNVGDFILVNGYLLQFVQPLSWFGYFLRKIRKGLTDMENVFNMLHIKAEIIDAPHATNLKTDHAEIVFDKVSFGYNPLRPILKNVSFRVPTGSSVAIVGSSGSGKSTIARLLFRFYDVTGGAILINNHDIRTVTQQSLQKMIGIVPQDTVLFNNTLYYNIAYGRPDATTHQIAHAAHLAHLDNFIKQLPEGLKTIVGERGLKLSGGEKQRVAIARVLLKKPLIYVFDEATSALDTKTEREIQKNLEEISAGSTTVIIAHRLSTVTHADSIIVLEHGVVAEQGTHEELLKKGSLYARLWQKQAIQKHDDKS